MTIDLNTLPEITDEEIRQQIADRLDHCQYGTTPFTTAEVDAIVRYARDHQGIPDVFAGLTADSIRNFRDEFGDTAALAMVRGDFRLIGQWQDAYTVLKLDALPRDDEGEFSPAATRFLGRELVDLQNATRALHAALAEYVLGKDENGYPYGALAPSGGYRRVDGMFWVDPA
ncbi:hypothetical protein [Streptomyces scabiei]|uniref:hypothetical protein n=1 Tax=Streptomyces scabiei TaxID=1930 RepID=UPI0029B04171|nr:hypothetical protein [Streptomyces scabiei]MDX2538611.1 hypothetical protein [Streptomyces scabiei]MDX2799885.1 hypothetical protein [Streptomyces scabiei]MDX2858168.1 hypothetical protein [Streptomyces scabiei]MDX3277863.1 hypothetical protein [Streptomyces scabiei]MDX3828540.1 hypothetical protein [Streptomyces scabiei]